MSEDIYIQKQKVNSQLEDNDYALYEVRMALEKVDENLYYIETVSNSALAIIEELTCYWSGENLNKYENWSQEEVFETTKQSQTKLMRNQEQLFEKQRLLLEQEQSLQSALHQLKLEEW